ncbi:MAG: O-antigen ligase family protein [Devosia sp.]|nr:O-antigen ligase family protein [Devosia sp.]
MTQPGYRRWSDASALAFLGFGFIIAPEPTWAAWFYVFVMPFGAWHVLRGWRPDWRDPRLMLLLGLIVWSTLTLLWADTPRPPPIRQWLWVWNGLCTLTFLLTIVALLEQSERMRDRAVAIMVACAAANAVYSVCAFLLRHGGWDRLEGWAETRNAILGASIMGVCTILALGRALRGGRWWPAWAASVPLFLAFIVLTDSRGPILTVVLAALVLLPARSLRTYAAILAAVVILAALIGLWQPEWVAATINHVVDRAIDRGTSYRLEIWQETLSEVARRPLVGHGPTASLRIDGGFGHHPHDLYLSALFYSGTVGLALLLAALAWLFRDVLRLPPGIESRTCLALLLHMVLSGATDLSQIIKGPGELWYIVWLPLAYALAVVRDPVAVAALQTRARISARACATVAARMAPRSPGKI